MKRPLSTGSIRLAVNASIVAATLLVTSSQTASAQRGSDGEGGGPRGGGEGRNHPIFFPPPAVTPAPPPESRPVVPPPRPFYNPVLVQTDLQSGLNSFPGNPSPADLVFNQKALDGCVMLKSMEFPQEDELTGPVAGITVKWLDGSRFSKPSDYVVKFDHGEILVSVKKPSKQAVIKTPFGTVAIAANGDVLARLDKGILRVTNLDGNGKAIKAKFDRKGLFDKPVLLALAAGSEIVAGENKLSRKDLRPRDGLARRGFKIIENSHLAISEISIHSILMHNDLITDLRQANSGAKERRILGDVSKMAAILNARNGTQGFRVEDESQVAATQGKTSPR